MIIEEQIISDEDWDIIWATFKREKPQTASIVLDEEGKQVLDELGVPKMEMKYSDVQWVKLELVNHISKICKRGADKIKLDDSPIDQALIARLSKDFVGI